MNAEGADVTGNYSITYKNGTLEVTKATLTVKITGKTDTKAYNGREQSVNGYTITIPEGTTLTVEEIEGPTQAETIAKGMDVDGGSNADKTYPMGLSTDNFSTTNKNYTVTFDVTDGWLKITPIAVTVVLHGNNSSVPYDGSEHTVTGYTVDSISSDLYTKEDFGLKEGKEATASRTEAGRTMMGLTGEDFENKNANFANVTFNVTDGYQTIMPIDVTVTITGANNTTDYDSEEHSVSTAKSTA